MTMFDSFLWPLHVINAWSTFLRLAPPVLNQPTAKQTEQEIVSRHSYGRQLGRMSDALSVLVGRTLREANLSEADAKRLGDFTDLVRRIDESREAMKRVEKVAAELARLRDTNPELHRQAAAVLKRALE